MRISFAGGGSDVALPSQSEKRGRVLGTAIDLRVTAVVEPFDKGWIELESPLGPPAVRRSSDAPRSDVSVRLLEAVLQRTGFVDGVRLAVRTDIAPGAGLGGSGATAVAAMAALYGSVSERLEPTQLAHEALDAERIGLRLACGLQDPLFAVLGGIMDISFEAAQCTGLRHIRLSPEFKGKLENGLLLLDTNLRRVSSEVLERISPEAANSGAKELVLAAELVARGLEQESLDLVLDGMHRNATAKAQRDPQGNAIAVHMNAKLGSLGARVVRLCGAGGGGHLLVWAPPERHAEIEANAIGFTIRKVRLAASGLLFDRS